MTGDTSTLDERYPTLFSKGNRRLGWLFAWWNCRDGSAGRGCGSELDLFLEDEDNALSVVGDVEVAILVFADTCDLERSIVEECALPDIANPP